VIGHADIVILIWTPDASRSPWLNREAEYSLGQKLGRVLPIVFDFIALTPCRHFFSKFSG
jgi:hypothetical protein